MSITIDDTTVASNPGRIDISRKKFAQYYGINRSSKIVLKIISFLPDKFTSFICKHNSTVYLYVSTKEKFKFGCINPTIVLDKNKSLLAVFTSLTASGTTSFPVIKIYKEKLNLVNTTQLENGTKLGSVALYSRSANELNPVAWVDFHPQLPNCFTDDYYKCEKIIESIKKEAWEALFLGVQQIDTIKEGLHKIELDNDLVQNAY